MYKKGEVFSSNSYGDFEIVDDRKWNDVEVRFINTGFVTSTFRNCIAKGAVKDKLYKNVLGVGCIGDGKYHASSHADIYSRWSGILSRCYNKDNKSYQHYGAKGVSVCKEWHNFQNFAEWHDDNYPTDGGEYEIDKDNKSKGNKTYSPESCVFISKKDNVISATSKIYKLITPRGDYLTIRNMSQFCADNGLPRSGMKALISESLFSYKGWRLQSRKTGITKNPENKNAKTYKVVSPTGEVTTITNMDRFCRERGLHGSLINKVLTGERKSHKGWTKP